MVVFGFYGCRSVGKRYIIDQDVVCGLDVERFLDFSIRCREEVNQDNSWQNQI